MKEPLEKTEILGNQNVTIPDNPATAVQNQGYDANVLPKAEDMNAELKRNDEQLESLGIEAKNFITETGITLDSAIENQLYLADIHRLWTMWKAIFGENGKKINNVTSGSPAVYKDQVIYTNYADAYTLYIKDIADLASNPGKPLNNVQSWYPAVYKDQVIYSNVDDNRKLYIKNIDDTSDGTSINNVQSYYPAVYKDQVIYRNADDGYKLYIKSLLAPIDPSDNGVAINEVVSSYPAVYKDPTGGGADKVIYSNGDDGLKLYIKDIADPASNPGIPINNVESNAPTIYNDQVIYANENDGYKLYIKDIRTDDVENPGDPINNVKSFSPTIYKDQVIYSNDADGEKLYILNLFPYLKDIKI